MIARLLTAIAMCLALAMAPARADSTQTARELVERGLAAHGGEAFLDPETLQLEGTAGSRTGTSCRGSAGR